jgi:hypothetical protein
MLTIGEYQIDETKINPAVQTRLLTRAIAHILNNESSSHVLNRTKRAIVGKDGKPDSVTDVQLAAFREANSQSVDTWIDEFCTSKITAMYDGTLSVRVSRGPTRDPVEAAMRAIAKSEIMGVLKSKGAKWPKADDTVVLGDVEFTGDELIDRRLSGIEGPGIDAKTGVSHADRLRKEAERVVKEANRLREATAKQVGAEAGAGGLAAALGL